MRVFYLSLFALFASASNRYSVIQSEKQSVTTGYSAAGRLSLQCGDITLHRILTSVCNEL